MQPIMGLIKGDTRSLEYSSIERSRWTKRQPGRSWQVMPGPAQPGISAEV